VIGPERSGTNKPAGIRTQMLIATGSALLTLVSIHLKDMYGSPNADPARLMAQIVAGVGFVGGGVILKSRERVYGVTTAATILVTAAVGIAIGSGFYIPAFTVICLVLLLKPIAKIQFALGLKTLTYILTIPHSSAQKVQKHLRSFQVHIADEVIDGDLKHLTIFTSHTRNADIIRYLSAEEIAFELRESDE
jgi:uncharacterized membrane protein YhiD involved in acid resistance